MQPDFWHERWHNKQIGFHQSEINPHLQQFWPAINSADGGRVFVPLCGKSRDMLWLRAQGREVVGIELSLSAVQAFFDENGLRVRISSNDRFSVYESDGICIYCGDFFDLAAADLAGITAVYDRASLIALPPEMRAAYADHMHGLLGPGTKTLLIAFEYPQHEMAGPPFSVHEEEVRKLYGEHCAIEVLRVVDILDQEPRFRDKGLTSLQEKIYALTYN
jgi:thiopurine S-methyltransferase